MIDFTGKNILVIGGSSGIGLALVNLLASNGAAVYNSSRSASSFWASGVKHLPMDVLGDTGGLFPFLPDTLHGLVYLPGSINLKPFGRLTGDDFINDYRINVVGAALIIQQTVKQLKAAAGASVVLMSSVAAKVGIGFHASIAAAKSGVEGLTLSLAAELAASNIRVNAVSPSLTDTPLAQHLLNTPEKKEAAGKRHPLGKYGKAADISSIIAFLLSDDSSWLTGQVIGIDGGLGSLKNRLSMETLKTFTANFLDTRRQAGDSDADQFINALFENPETKRALQARLGGLTGNNQLSAMQGIYGSYSLINDAATLPVWADKRLMKQGAAFFATHAQLIMNMLGLLSLPYCYTAANGAMVLYLSERMRTDAGKRLTETAGFVWEVMSPGAFEAGGKGFAAILKVRLMHAAVRYYTLKNEKWDEKFGFPVNQEDMAGTNLSFSLIVTRGLRKFGLTIAYADQQAFMHLWNIIGCLLGLDERLLPANGKEAFVLEEAIRVRQFGQSEQGRFLTATLIDYFRSINTGGQFSNSEITQVMRYLLGDEVADLLGIPPESLAANKLALLKLVNNINALKPAGKPQVAYQTENAKFRKAKPVY